MADGGSGHDEPVRVDEIDRRILQLLQQDGRRTVRDVAERVNLTVAPVSRRIARLEAQGVISGYGARVDYSRIGGSLEAVTELRFAGDLDLAHIVAFAAAIPEVEEVLTMAGDPDAFVRIRVRSIEQLQHVVNRLRTGGGVTGTKTQVVLESWRKPEE
ncbi:Lrp/AsnC family transcriptional regulator [Jatrophihabitans fulvus]